jgi:PqqD family protein of HPr-rel-A system
MGAPSSRWQVSPGYAIRAHKWEDGYTVFHGGSGDTHLLDHFTGQILSSLLRQPMSLDDLARSVAGEPLAQLDDSTAHALDSAVAALHRVHVVEPYSL